MALIKDEDIQLVRERARIDEVVEQYVTLRNAGGGARKGLCPFHDEKTPSFNVRPAQGFYHCFGCGAGGDSIKFLMEIEGLPFAEAVERLAGRYGIQVRYEEDGQRSGPRRDPRQRQRLLEAHRMAGEFYAAALTTSAEAQPGRQLVTDRGFTSAHAETFGMGWAPRSGTALTAHLTGRGFTEEELLVGGLARRSSRGMFDVFQGRLLWPIREMTGEIIGFGARRMFEDDFMSGKYVNTSETPIYKKSQVLYGIDLARRQISGSSQAVVVEGYTDVMACHVAGVTTAIATCGTAFGEGHTRILRRIMLDHDAFRGEVIFTFDGDEAGQRAAVKAFEGDQEFAGQTYVAIEPRGMDPCDLRMADGDPAVRELIASRVPLYRFVLDSILERYDLDRGDQRVDAVREAVGLVVAIRDHAKVEAFLREIAGRVGVEVDQVRTEHRRSAASGARPAARPAPRRSSVDAPDDTPVPAVPAGPPFGAPEFTDEREALKAIAQYPHLVGSVADDLGENDFTHPVARRLWAALAAEPWPTAEDASWIPKVAESLDEDLRPILAVAAVEPLRARETSTAAMVAVSVFRLQALTLGRQVADLKSKLQRTNPVDEAESYNRMFGELIALEQQHRVLRDRAVDGTVAD
ncbi:DNA primase [Aeromicrobium marinum DSM 15272]|uniref:DNA primase n=1 Tax=Aeromicrobium marinum DSM 15272 TaxID=585531 RepID=E2SAY3_9ACTN|nr:DNA primase [Aeromicrobium marinum]EFQ83529.1 DNA primase [Aeromicrobium marinum DSM 15272]